jgi:hypothetical protein
MPDAADFFTLEQRERILDFLRDAWIAPVDGEPDIRELSFVAATDPAYHPAEAFQRACLGAALWGFQCGYWAATDPEWPIRPVTP